MTRPGGIVIVSVPALPDLYTEFDRIQGHRRRYRPETLRAAFDGSGLALEQVFWWGQWLVPALRRQRARVQTRPGESASEAYLHYLKLPPWPLPWIARMAFRYEQDRRFGANFIRARRYSRSRAELPMPGVRKHCGALD